MLFVYRETGGAACGLATVLAAVFLLQVAGLSGQGVSAFVVFPVFFRLVEGSTTTQTVSGSVVLEVVHGVRDQLLGCIVVVKVTLSLFLNYPVIGG